MTRLKGMEGGINTLSFLLGGDGHCVILGWGHLGLSTAGGRAMWARVRGVELEILRACLGKEGTYGAGGGSRVRRAKAADVEPEIPGTKADIDGTYQYLSKPSESHRSPP